MTCAEKFEEVEPKEVIVRIGALEEIHGGLAITPSVETSIQIDDEQWFEGGIKIKYRNLVEGKNNIQIRFEANPILAFEFFDLRTTKLSLCRGDLVQYKFPLWRHLMNYINRCRNLSLRKSQFLIGKHLN